MLRCLVVLVVATIFAACGQEGRDESSQPEVSTAPVAIGQPALLSGKQAYENTCASCHDDGIDGAPRTGDRDAWSGRSRLWEAVLFEHAKQGYLQMPARGGDESLDDTTIARAAEYMLTLTFPEMPRN